MCCCSNEGGAQLTIVNALHGDGSALPTSSASVFFRVARVLGESCQFMARSNESGRCSGRRSNGSKRGPGEYKGVWCVSVCSRREPAVACSEEEEEEGPGASCLPRKVAAWIMRLSSKVPGSGARYRGCRRLSRWKQPLAAEMLRKDLVAEQKTVALAPGRGQGTPGSRHSNGGGWVGEACLVAVWIGIVNRGCWGWTGWGEAGIDEGLLDDVVRRRRRYGR